MPRSIAIVTQAYHPSVGGVTEHVAGTARALRARGNRVTIITSGDGRNGNGATEPDVVRLGRNLVVPFNGAENNVTVGRGLRRSLEALLGPAARGRFDVAHVHCPLSPVLPMLALDVAAIPVVGTVHTTSDSDFLLRLFRGPLSRYAARLDRMIAVSEPARDYVTRHFPREATIVPNGVDLDRFRPGAPRLERYDDGVPNILFVGRFDPRKGLPDLLRACARLAREGVPFRLILVGDGRLRGRVERLARGALDGRVHFEGRVDHDRLPAYYATADLFCSPATGGESFGMVLLEAMALGVPVIATDLPGHRTVVAHDREGLLVPRRDPAALAGAIRRLLSDAGERRRLGANGLARAASYGWDAIAERLEAIYDAATRA
ncbi:MAG TPA: glycosyltransferase family 4 protein [Acidobacteriota bacterium]|nr:glycosyltransferase family 4 protein [Acidobacteriota bacterium]